MPTVHDLRNQIRVAVDRYERVESTGFTKETLAAIANDVGYDVQGPPYPKKSEMRAGILWKIGELDEPAPGKADTSFNKAPLQSIADAVTDEGRQ